MTRTNDNITLDRSALGTVFGFIGVVGLLLAVIAFAWYVRVSAVVVIALAVGLVGFTAWAAVAPKDFVATLTGRSARYGTTAILAAVLLLGVIVLTYIIVARANIAVDTTLGREFSLSDATFDVLDRVPGDLTIQITGFYSADALAERALDDQFLRQYEIESDGRVQVHYIDLDEQPAVAQRFGATQSGEIFVSTLDESGSVNFDTLTYVSRQNKQERDVTAAIQRMLNERVFKVYFAESLATLSVFDESNEGLVLLDNSLRLSGVQTETLNLVQLANAGGIIPDDAAVVVLPRPSFSLTDAQVSVLSQYLGRGGSLLILADVMFNDDEFLAEGTPFANYLLQNYGLRAYESVIVDPPYEIETPLDVIAAATFLEHPVGNAVQRAGGTTFFRLARRVEAVADRPPSVANGRIMSSSPQSYAETDLGTLSSSNEFEQDPAIDPTGPFDYVVWAQDTVENGGNGSKVMLIGDGDFVMSRNLDAGAQGNLILFGESVLWLAGVDENVEFGFAANPSAIPTMFVSGQQLDVIGIVTIVVVPLTVLLAGIVVWYRRTFA